MALSFPEIRSTKDLHLLADTAQGIWREYFPGIITDEQIHAFGYRYFFVAEEENILGYIGVHEEEKALFLSKLYLKKEYRGRGYFSGMLAFCENLAREKSLFSLYLTVNRGNSHSVQVYEAKGFRTIREQIADIGAGYVMDDYVMEKKLI